MEISGKVTKIFDTQTFASGFKKREVIVTTQEQYPQPLSIEFLQDKTELADQINVGDDVKVSINLRGREWTSPDGVVKYFNSIVGWRVEKLAPENVGAENTPSPSDFNSGVNDLSNDGEIDDLPF
ncbi:DUF3127 domain-containing protein [Weeksellaceae bacterium KMM 9713]|uniref:DUF3127 domain-containing protein n=1 Tax=Profundicola chukchiensis TaxID=2961959 RepID=A0A9X4MYY0_9FLAO|nr:DUF3127 domain-containing protein [Profundicola chukchiensis]MDG4945275.1 DUF3127 domain-containing protein [Profundicola chukchiensis]MDG4950350.1 DUF3127 domain-containing protein [Profundicola chukchiensis]